MLKYSFYNIEIEKFDKGYLVYNSFSNGFAIFDLDFMEFLKNNNLIDKTTVEDKDLKKKIEVAETNGFLIDSEINEFESIKLKRNSVKYGTDSLYLTIATTMSCNFSCPYCYEKRNNITMQESVIEDIARFVKYKAQRIKFLYITWYGGEPLLASSVIQNLSEKLLKICSDEHIVYQATIITNGYLLTESMAKMLSKYRVTNAQVTLDGFKESHNKRRNTKAAGDSFSIITNNIDVARKYILITIRANIDEQNSDDIEKLINFCLEKGWNSQTGVKLYFSRVHEQNANEYDEYLIDEEAYSDLNSNTKKMLIDKLEKDDGASIYPFKVSLPCSAMSINSLVIAPDGNLYKCWEEIDQKDCCVGNVKEGLIVNDTTLRWLNNDIPIDCQKCKLLPACPGDCIMRRLDKNYSNCKFTNAAKYKEIIQSLKLYYEYYKAKSHTQN